MGRPRKRSRDGLPDYVYCNKGRFFLREPGRPERLLAPDSATKAEVWRAYLAMPPREQVDAAAPLTLRELLKKYRESARWLELSSRTRLDAKSSHSVMCRQVTKSGREFGDYPIEKITAGVMRLYVDKRGEATKKRANAELAYASSAFSWAFERDLVKFNPCKGIKKYTLPARERYITDQEYADRYELAGEKGRRDVQVMMEIAYLCRLRENEIVKTLDSPRFITADGFLAVRGKGSKTQLIGWTPRLKAAIDFARQLKQEALERRKKTRRPASPSMCLITTRFGRPLTLSAFSNAWQDLQVAARERGQATDWHFHDIKAKGVSDFEGDQHLASGHKTRQMTAVYQRKLEVVEGTR